MKNITKKKLTAMLKVQTQAEVAAALGVSQPAIAYHAKRLGIATSRQKKLKFN
jgi:Zn-dependent peptidase ImmA (M78 family)